MLLQSDPKIKVTASAGILETCLLETSGLSFRLFAQVAAPDAMGRKDLESQVNSGGALLTLSARPEGLPPGLPLPPALLEGLPPTALGGKCPGARCRR